MTRPGPRFGRTVAAALVAALVPLACEDDAIGTSQAGVTAVVEDENPDAQAAAFASLLPLQTAADYSGTLSGDTRVDVSADGETWVQLGDATQIELELQSAGDEVAVHSDVTVPLETFAFARLVLDGADVEIDPGSTIGGVTLESSATLTIGSGTQVTVEQQLEQELDLDVGSDATLTFDLNSETWVTQDNLDDMIVSEAELRSAVDVRVSGA